MNHEDRLAIQLTRLDGVAVVEVRGEIDALTAPHLQESVQLACEWGVPVVLDMARVTFMDSSGVSALLVVSGVGNGRPSSVHVQRPSEAVQRTLSIAGLDETFLLEP